MYLTSRKNLLRCALAIAALCSPLLASASTPPTNSCAQVMLIGARGTGEPQGFGYLLGPIVSQVQSAARPTVSTYALPYPASADFYNSEMQGIIKLEQYLAAQSQACPAQRFVLLGYSQGAQVMGYAMQSPTLTQLASRISAITFFGDPNFNPTELYDAGSYNHRVAGIAGARANGALSLYAPHIRNYCNGNDGICQTGQALIGHLQYQYTAAGIAENYILSKIE